MYSEGCSSSSFSQVMSQLPMVYGLTNFKERQYLHIGNCSFVQLNCMIQMHSLTFIFAHFARLIRTKGVGCRSLTFPKKQCQRFSLPANLCSMPYICSVRLSLLIWPGLFNLRTGTAILMRRIWNICPISGSCSSNYIPFHQNIAGCCHCKSWFIVRLFPCYCWCFPPTL